MARRHISSSSFQLGELRAFASSLKISLHASVIRLIELDVYSKDALAAWIAFQRENINPDSESKSGGRRVEEWKYKLAKHGYKFADVYGHAVNENKIDSLDVFRLSRIKPKYQSDYFRFASTATLEDVDDE